MNVVWQQREEARKRVHGEPHTCHGGIDRCRESQGWATACSSMPERDAKDQGVDSLK